MKAFPDFVFTRHGNASIWLARNRASAPVIECFADPDRLFQRSDCVIVKDQKKIKVGRVAIEFAGEAVVCYIKRYNAFSARYRLQSLFARSGALRSLCGAMLLRHSDLLTGKPIAAIEERRWGMLDKSYYVAEEIAGGKTADAYWRENLQTLGGVDGVRKRRRFLRQMSRLFQRLHRGRIYHNDLKDFNIMVHQDSRGIEEFFLLDLEGVRRCRYLSGRRRIKNLVQLNRTLGQFLTRSEKLCFLKSYFAGERVPPKRQSFWVEKILGGSARADRRSLAKRGREGTASRLGSHQHIGVADQKNGTGSS